MKKQNKKTARSLFQRLFATKKRGALTMLVTVALIAIVSLASGYGWALVYNYRQTSDYASADSIRQLIVSAIDNLGREAPIDYKTGDVYFPEARLYLPQPSESVRLGYASSSSQDKSEISIFDRTALNLQKQKLLAAANVNKVFDAVPDLQACSRGMSLTYDKATLPVAHETSKYYIDTIKLANGKTLYAYGETSCTQNGKLAQMLEDLRAY